MSNAITDARTDVAAALGSISGLKVWSYIPAQMTAPAAIVTPGSPYVLPGQVLGEVEVSLNVRLFASRGTNEVVSEALDSLIVDCLGVLNEYGVSQVSQPGVDEQSYNTPYLVTDITIKTTYRLEND